MTQSELLLSLERAARELRDGATGNHKEDCFPCRIADLLDLARAEIQRRDAYWGPNPLGGPAKVFHAMACRISAGEDYFDVLADYRFDTIPSSAFRSEAIRKAIDAAGHVILGRGGYVMVPEWPTEKMLKDGADEFFDFDGSDLKRRDAYKIVRKMYRAMLAAATDALQQDADK